MAWIVSSIVLIASCLGLSLGMGHAATLAQSTFDAGDEGWTVGDFFTTLGGGVPTYVAAGGNPGGFIRTGDLFAWNAYVAPAPFLGNQLGAYGGILHVDQRLLSSDGINYPMVVISDGVTRLQFRTSPPTTDWTSYDILLTAAAGWEIADGSGTPGLAASELQLQTVLGNLTFLHLDADWQSGDDRVDLDNVRLCSGNNCDQPGPPGQVPLPATLWLVIAGGLAGLSATARRRP